MIRTSVPLILALTLFLPAAPVAQQGRSTPTEAARAVPAPASVFGFEPGADYKLATYDQVIEYFKSLAAASPYVKLFEAGRTSQGRVMYFALVSAPDNLARIDTYRAIARRLAHPEGLTEPEARRLAREGRALIHIDGGLHSTEVAGGQHAPLLAYNLVRRANEPETRLILDNVILMLWPTINPDGQQMVAEWYMRNVGTPYELSALPWLYQDYVGHDNNRDAYMLNMVESRVVEQAWRQWEPQIVYVHHQVAPFPTRIWLPPFSEPVGSDAPFLMSREVNMIGMAIAKGLEERGQVGATHMGRAFDAWYPGYVDYAPNFKNVAAFWTETALYSYATPREYTLDDFPQDMRDFRPRSLYASPWRPGWWRLRDAVDYMETASLSVMDYAARYKDSLLLNRYKAGIEQIARGRREAPFAYIVPQDQRDRVAPVEMLRRLAFGGIRVSQLTRSAEIDGATYPAGTWVVPTDQEFGAMARQLLDVQRYPDLRQYPGGPPEQPYDAAGWTLPLQMGVTVVAATSPLSEAARSAMKALGSSDDPRARPSPYNLVDARDASPFDSLPAQGFDTHTGAAAIVPLPGRITGDGPALVVDPAQNNAYRAINAAWKQGGSVEIAAASGETGPGFIIRGLSADAQATLVESLALAAARTAAAGTPLKKPRIGLFRPWSGAMDEGWSRWLLERYGFDLVTLRPADLETALDGKVDVVILADDARIPLEGTTSGRGGRGGGAPAGGRGAPGGREVRPEYADTVSADDIQRLEQFVRSGGRVVCLNNASAFIIDRFKLPVKNVVTGLAPQDFFLRGSIVQVAANRSHPVMAGMADRAAVFVDRSPVWETLEGFTGTVLARYAEAGTPLLSGYLIGEKHLQGKAAALDVRLDAGHVVLLGFRPTWRGQPFASFKVLFNAALGGY